MTHTEASEVTMTVDRLLAHAELTLSSDDRAALIDVYPHIRALVARLRIDSTRSVPPALTFLPTRPADLSQHNS